MGTAVTEWIRLIWKVQRWELSFVIGGSLLLAAAMAVVAWQIQVRSDAIAACYELPEATWSADCRSLVDMSNLLGSAVGVLSGAATVAPFGVGIFLGAPFVAGEIEHRTAPMAWSLSLSRRSWLMRRVLPLVVVIGVVLLLLGQTSELLLRSVEEGPIDFRHYGQHGPILAARGLSVFGIGVLAGLALGRVLPAILVTALATVVLVGLTSIGRDQLMRAEAEWIAPGSEIEALAMIYDSRLRDAASGELVTYEEVFAEFPSEELDPETGVPPGFTQLYLAVPPDKYPSFVAREIAALGGSSVLVLALGWWRIASRRPA